MKLFFTRAVLVVFTASGVLSTPLVKRASVSDSAFGFASLNGGTTGGDGGTEVTVSTLDDLRTYAEADGAYVIYVSGVISGDEVLTVSSDKTIIGKSAGVTLTGVGFTVKRASNVIIRNLVIEKCLAPTDAVTVQASSNVWIDHIDASSDMDHDKDYYDGLVDINHGSDYVTVSNSYLHDHWKTSLVGYSDYNGDEDSGHLTITYAYNHWENLNSRCPSFRFGTGHMYNNYFNTISDGANIRNGTVALIENNVFTSVDKPVYSVDGLGSAELSGNDFGDAAADITTTSVSMSYDYTLKDATSVVSYVQSNAGAILSF